MKTKLLTAIFGALVLLTIAPAQTPAPTSSPATAAPVDAAALHQLGVERLQQKNAREAVAFAEQATKADPTRPEYFSQLGIALSERMDEVNFMQLPVLAGKLRKAFEKSITLDPNHVPGLIGLARFYAQAPEIAGGSLEKAAEFAARVRQIDPATGEAELGRVAERGEDFAGALAHYETAAQLKPDSAGRLSSCGRMLAKLGRKDEAARVSKPR
ncbi:MAG: hypothetical protein WDM96_13380 [Lacunisphaera sp.]